MKTAVLVILGLLILGVGGVLALAMTKPDTFSLQRSASINAPPETILAYLNDFRHWRVWSPWEKLDPELKRTYSGAPQGVGAIYAWEGNKQTGAGRMEITEASPSRVALKLDFTRPFQANNLVDFTLVPAGNATNVTWTMRGPNKFIGKVMSVFISFDKMVGKSFEEGLASLKAAAEKGPPANETGRLEQSAMIKVSAFRWVPPFAQGLVREFRVRWALEEAGRAYEERLIGPEDKATASYRMLQPFGQVPAYEENRLTLFESGAIVLHIAEGCDALMPPDVEGRLRTVAWMFAALNSVEPAVQHLAEIDLFYSDEEWAKQRRPDAVKAASERLQVLAHRVSEREFLEDRFTAGDLLMTTVLRILRHTDLVTGAPALDAYVRRCEARPAFRKAMADHMALFARHAA